MLTSELQPEEVNNEKEINQGKSKIWESPLLRQTFVLFGPISLMLCAGITQGTSTVMIPQIKLNGTIILTKDVETWLYSIHGFGTFPSVLTLPYLSQAKGYKFSFIFVCFPIIISFILQYFATNGTHLLIAALMQGLTMGGNIAVGVLIVSEFAEPKYRGTFLILKTAMFFWGIWIANAIGTFSSWKNIPLFGIWPAILTLLTYPTWPESPYWLASKNKMEECKKAFRWVRGPGREAANELNLLINQKHIPRKSKNRLISFKSIVMLRQFYMPFFLNIAMFFLYHACGKYVCQTYVLVIIKNITKNDTAAHTGMLIIDGVTIFGMYLGSYVAAKVKRRIMFFSTSACTIFCLYIFSAYLYLIQYKVIKQSNTVTLVLLIFYSFAASWGPMVLCPSVYSEITPMRFKPFITSITVCFMFTMHSGFLKLAPHLFENIGVSGSFAVYATLTLIPTLFMYKYLPETKNKTLEEIENLFIKKNRYDSDDKVEGQEMLTYDQN